MFIDADAHVDENADTWSYFPEALSDFRPAEMDFVEGETPRYLRAGNRKGTGSARGLFIEGQLFSRRNRDDEKTQTTADTRELRDIPTRLKHMDDMGVSTQIIYPSTLLSEVTARPEVEIAICESYNRWLADRCGESSGRIRWNAILPLRSMPDALKEMRRVKEAGAVGIFKRPFETDNRRAGAEYFYPMYELAQELDLPICMHLGGPYTGFTGNFTKTRSSILNELYVVDAFLSILLSGTYERFPRLRWGFIEASASWLPFALYQCNYTDIHRSTSAAVATEKEADRSGLLPHFEEILNDGRIFVTCEASENLPLILSQVGDSLLCVGTDYGHSDRSAIRYGHRAIAERDDLGEGSGKRITVTNGEALYGLATVSH